MVKALVASVGIWGATLLAWGVLLGLSAAVVGKAHGSTVAAGVGVVLAFAVALAIGGMLASARLASKWIEPQRHRYVLLIPLAVGYLAALAMQGLTTLVAFNR